MPRRSPKPRLPLSRWRPAVPLVAGALIVSACSNATSTNDAVGTNDGQRASGVGGSDGARDVGATSEGGGSESVASAERALPPPLSLEVPAPDSVYDPVGGGEELPSGYRQLLNRDAIAPVYDPSFVASSGVDWPEESLVIGVDLEGEARAYPVGFLNRREIVNDNHRGIPTLVTW